MLSPARCGLTWRGQRPARRRDAAPGVRIGQRLLHLLLSFTNLEGEPCRDVQFIGGVGEGHDMNPRAHECLENARRCDSLATQAKDPLVKAGLQEAARHWRERAKRLEQQFVAESDQPIRKRSIR
jgi:hypothetical protein